MAREITAQKLKRWMDEGHDFVLIDILPEEYFDEAHLPGAKRAGIFEINFPVQIAQLKIHADRQIVVYGASDASHDTEMAVEKLSRLGFRNLLRFSGGRAAWREAHFPFEGKGAPEPVAYQEPPDRTFSVQPKKSALEWTGRNLNSIHRGFVKISAGEIITRHGTLHSARFTIAMDTISNTDLPSGPLRKMLEAHLKSDDFFDVENFPTAELKIMRAEPILDAKPGSPNFLCHASLTMKGVRNPLEFQAIVAATENETLTALARIEIDRTRWKVIYGSGRFFEMLGKHLVNDTISLLVRVVAA